MCTDFVFKFFTNAGDCWIVSNDSICMYFNLCVFKCCTKGAWWCSGRVLTSEAIGSNLRPGASCWKVGSNLPMPSGLQCTMHWFPPPVKLPI